MTPGGADSKGNEVLAGERFREEAAPVKLENWDFYTPEIKE